MSLNFVDLSKTVEGDGAAAGSSAYNVDACITGPLELPGQAKPTTYWGRDLGSCRKKKIADVFVKKARFRCGSQLGPCYLSLLA